MNSFFDLDQNPAIERPCGHYTIDLICCRRLSKIWIQGTKSSEGVKIILAVWSIDQGSTNKIPGMNERYIHIVPVRFVDSGLAIRRMSASDEVQIHSKRALSVSDKSFFFGKIQIFGHYELFFDSDEILWRRTSCAHYTLYLICFGSLLKSRIGATKSTEGEKMKTLKKSQKL